jgi:hypothetical protein
MIDGVMNTVVQLHTFKILTYDCGNSFKTYKWIILENFHKWKHK